MTRRRRRVVAPPTRLGASQEGALTALAPRRDPAPAPGADPQPASAPEAAGGAQRETGDATPPAAATAGPPTIPDRAAEDTDAAWGEDAEHGDDARILREKPPHWR